MVWLVKFRCWAVVGFLDNGHVQVSFCARLCEYLAIIEWFISA